MKKTFVITILGTLALASCHNFLEVPIEGSLPSAGLDYSNKENIFLPVSAAYASLRDGNAHAFSYISLEIISDNADKGSSPTDNPDMIQFDTFTLTPANGLVNNLWTGYFNIVSAANHAIEQMPRFVEALQSEEDREYARQCEGEARFIRAYAYFNLVRIFGSLPKIDHPMTSGELAALQPMTRAQSYEFIKQDLTDAIAVLPASYSKEFAGRVTRYSAMALKAKVHLYCEEWNDAATLSDGVIASRQFDLLGNFREVFAIEGENSRESLFEIQSSTLGLSSGTDIPYIEYAYVQGPRGNSPGNMQGWGFCVPSDDLIAFYTARGETVRPATTLLYRGTTTPEGDEIRNTCENPVYNGKVYTPSAYNKWSYNGYGFDHNLRVLRYAELLLMYAEALTQGGVSSAETPSGMSAQEALDKVRTRAGLDSAPVGLQTIWDERRAELAMEEDRWFDLVRTGQAATELGSLGFVAGKHELYPIPTAQRSLNTNLAQNPGY